MLGDLPRDVLVMVMVRAGPQAQMNTLSKDLYEVLDVHKMNTNMLIKIVLNNFKEHPVITRYEKTLKALVVMKAFEAFKTLVLHFDTTYQSHRPRLYELALLSAGLADSFEMVKFVMDLENPPNVIWIVSVEGKRLSIKMRNFVRTFL